MISYNVDDMLDTLDWLLQDRCVEIDFDVDGGRRRLRRYLTKNGYDWQVQAYQGGDTIHVTVIEDEQPHERVLVKATGYMDDDVMLVLKAMWAIAEDHIAIGLEPRKFGIM